MANRKARHSALRFPLELSWSTSRFYFSKAARNCRSALDPAIKMISRQPRMTFFLAFCILLNAALFINFHRPAEEMHRTRIHWTRSYSSVPVISDQNSDGITVPSFDLFSTQPSPPLEVDPPAALFDSCTSFCQDNHCKNQCIALDTAIEAFRARTQDCPSSPGIVFIRLDFLAASRGRSSYWNLFESTLKTVKSSPRFLKYGHSDHAFLCMIDGCDKVLSDMTRKTEFGRETRAIWVSRSQDIESFARAGGRWPCRDRLLAAAENDIKSVLVEVEKRIVGPQRWSCQGRWILGNGRKRLVSKGCLAHLMTSSRHKLVAFPIRKSGSSELTSLMRRIAGTPRWRDTSKQLIYGDNMDMERIGRNWTSAEAWRNMEDPEWKRIIFVRDPVARFLSGYLNKIVAFKQYYRVNWKGKEMPTIEQVIETFEALTPTARAKLDVHFRPQSARCAIASTRFDFIARVESLDDDIKDMLKSMDMWESYGASGWGPNGDLAFAEYDIYAQRRKQKVDTKRQTHAAEKIHKYLTQDLIRRVQEVYKDDYDVFGYNRSTWII